MIGAMLGRAKKYSSSISTILFGEESSATTASKNPFGRETAVAEAYTAFQEYCLSLRERGVLLAVCSKNNLDTAKSGFTHPDTVLKLSTSLFQANWEPKHHNIETIARELNLGLDSFVFVDDNPAERAIVTAQLPADHRP